MLGGDKDRGKEGLLSSSIPNAHVSSTTQLADLGEDDGDFAAVEELPVQLPLRVLRVLHKQYVGCV